MSRCHRCGASRRLTAILHTPHPEALDPRTVLVAISHCRDDPTHDVAGSSLASILTRRAMLSAEQWRVDDQFPPL